MMSFRRTFSENFLRVLDHALSQYRFVRFLMGGIWIKVSNDWMQVNVLSYCKDGTRILWWSTHDGQSVSFHEHHNQVQALESFT
jgi:hypothetical protein